MDASCITVFGPASLSNLGPGFDALGMCIEGFGDIVRAKRTVEKGITIDRILGDGGVLPLDPKLNTVAVGAQHVLNQTQADFGLSLEIEKGIPLGSGIGGSSASAVAGVFAANALLDEPLPKSDLVNAVLQAEATSSGLHGDNVLPALFGGTVLVSAANPYQYRALTPPSDLHLAVCLPDVQVITREARAILPKMVSLKDAVSNAADLGFWITAYLSGDWELLGQMIMQDRLVEPYRAQLVPCYEVIKQAAMLNGAYGCALSGSGPAMFALAQDDAHAQILADAMKNASERMMIAAQAIATKVNLNGVCVINQP